MGFYPAYEINYEMGEAGLGMLLGFYLVYFVMMIAISVGAYILQSLGMYAIAKRREIEKPWLAWLPIGSDWILGSISDQYRYVTKGQIKNKRKAMLTMNILLTVPLIMFFVGIVLFVVQIAAYSGNMYMAAHAYEPQMFVALSVAVVAWFLMMGLAIALTVIRFVALFDLYRSCEPDNGTLFLVLSILIPITQPIFLFLYRNRDEGMPPRRPQPFEE